MNKSRTVHEVDGIEEEDNKLPRWWLYGFYLTIGFAVCYWFVYQVYKIAPYPIEELRLAEARKAAAEPPLSAEALAAIAAEPGRVASGKQVFGTICAGCHRADGGGLFGPNLTDGAWLHGGQPSEIYHTVSSGWPDKGMPAWRPILGTDKTADVVAYVLSIRNSNAPNGKEMQGILQ